MKTKEVHKEDEFRSDLSIITAQSYGVTVKGAEIELSIEDARTIFVQASKFEETLNEAFSKEVSTEVRERISVLKELAICNSLLKGITRAMLFSPGKSTPEEELLSSFLTNQEEV